MDFDGLYDELDQINKPEKDIIVTHDKCCDNINNYIFNDQDIIACKICDKYINNVLSSPEWRFFGQNDSKRMDPTRCGMPINILLPKSSVGTVVNNRGNTFDRVSTRQRWNSMPYKELSKYKIFVDIDNRCKTHKLPQIICETAKSLYSIISETKISRGDNRKGIIAACVFNACKECNVPRTIKEIAEIFDLNPKVLTKGCKKFTEIIRINKININRTNNLKTIQLSDFIERFCCNLSIDTDTAEIINDIADICKELNLVYINTPPAMATGCIYYVIQLKRLDISKKEISEKCNISEVTINKCYKKLDSDESFKKEVLKNI